MLIGVLLATVTLEALPARNNILVAEPLRLTLAWRAETPTPVFISPTHRSIVVSVNDGVSTHRYRESSLSSFAEIVEAPTQLEPGRETYSDEILVFGQYEGGVDTAMLFPRPGAYTLRFHYSDHTGLAVDSGPVSVTVSEPSAPDAEVLMEVRQNPFDMKYGGPLATGLLEAHPQSPYLRLARLEVFRQREARLIAGRDPATDEDRRTSMPTDAWDSFVAGHLKATAQELLNEPDWGPLEDIRLALIVDYSRRGGDPATAEAAAGDLLRRFPRSSAAQRLGVQRDTTPPQLTLSASPQWLWPPNHKLNTVAVSAQVADDLDPQPRIKLVSITCDDGCDPALDVIGAILGTDDREFSLRAARLGTGVGRTYTITYLAQDKAGNRTTATTTVTVPHDQRDKK